MQDPQLSPLLLPGGIWLMTLFTLAALLAPANAVGRMLGCEWPAVRELPDHGAAGRRFEREAAAAITHVTNWMAPAFVLLLLSSGAWFGAANFVALCLIARRYGHRYGGRR